MIVGVAAAAGADALYQAHATPFGPLRIDCGSPAAHTTLLWAVNCSASYELSNVADSATAPPVGPTTARSRSAPVWEGQPDQLGSVFHATTARINWPAVAGTVATSSGDGDPQS